MYKLIILAALAALAIAIWEEDDGNLTTAGDRPGFPDGDPAAAEEQVRSELAYRQHEVNLNAVRHYAGVGTAPYRGVPGTSLEKTPVRHYGYNNAHYPDGHYGYGPRFHAGYHPGNYANAVH